MLKNNQNTVFIALNVVFLLCSLILSSLYEMIRSWALKQFLTQYAVWFQFVCILISVSIIMCIIHYQYKYKNQISKWIVWVVMGVIIGCMPIAVLFRFSGFPYFLKFCFALLVVQGWMKYNQSK